MHMQVTLYIRSHKIVRVGYANVTAINRLKKYDNRIICVIISLQLARITFPHVKLLR